MKMESYDLSLREIFDKKNYLFEIPNYQRSYVWEKDEISEYLKDITYCYEENSQGRKYEHFIGQMIFRTIKEDRAARNILEVVDGQQRLTTTTLMVAAIYRLILIYDDVADQNVLNILRDLKKEYIISEADRGTTCRKLKLSSRDNTILTEIATVKEEKITDEFEFQCTYESERRILSAYEQIFKYLEGYFKSLTVSSWAKSLYNFVDVILRNISVVMIKPKSIGYSYALYQIVNDRGVLLTPAELLKARTMELLHNNPVLFNKCEEAWNDILNDPGNETTKYLTWHYAAMADQSVAKSKLHEMYEKKIFLCHGKHNITDDEQIELSRQIHLLHQSVKWCRELSIGKLPADNIHPQISDMFAALVVGLKNEIAIPIYINALRINSEKIKKKFIPFITVLISRFFFSTRTIANIHNGTISSVYNTLSSLAKEESVDYEKMIEVCRKKQIDKSVPNAFSINMDDSIYSKTATPVSKYLLYLIELFHGCTDITYKHILERDESMTIVFEKVTTEHIAARSGMDGNVLTEHQRDCLGNLTLLGGNKNNDLDDKPFSYKKEIYKNSPFSMTRDVAINNNWEKEVFESRQTEMKEKAIKIFII